MTELEEQKITTGGKAKLYETQIVALEEEKSSLAASLKLDIEQKVDIEPLKKHALMIRNKIHQIQLQIAEERFKVQQIDIRLEEIVSTTSYFLDRTQNILETLRRRMAWVDANKESPTDICVKDQDTIRQEHELNDFSSNAVEELKKEVKRTQGACAEFCGRVLLTYNRC